jgi:hypothetical protein
MTELLPMLTPGAAVLGPSELLVFHDVTADDVWLWRPLVTDVARVLGLEPSYTPIDMHHREWVGRLLQASVGAPGPVLVLPRAQAPGNAGLEPSEPAHLARVVVASGDAPDVVRCAGELSRRLRRDGVHTTVLVVLSNDARPPMWEGAGHHAAAWREELERRHQGPDRLRVLPGVSELGSAIHRHALDADVIALVWRQVATEGRALVIRSVLGEGDRLACLLVPIGRLESSRSARLGSGRPAPTPEAMAPR